MENRGEEVAGLQLSINTIDATTDIPTCMMIQEIQEMTVDNAHLQVLGTYIIGGWPIHGADVSEK